ncbi:hypothetical protein [Nocardioides sp. HB32]
MTATDLDAQRPVGTPPRVTPPAERTVDWRRLRSPVATVALVACAIAAVGTSLGSLVAGHLAEDATSQLVELLALCVVGAAVLDTGARTLWAGVVDRAEGRLRADLLDAALHPSRSRRSRSRPSARCSTGSTTTPTRSARCCARAPGSRSGRCSPPARSGWWPA